MTAAFRRFPALSRENLFGAAAVAAAALLQFLTLPGAYLGFENDDALYVLAARALADGQGYHFPTLPGSPPNHLFPPGLPALLAPWAWLLPDRPGIYPLASWLSLALCDLAAWLWLKARLGFRLGLSLFLLFALHPLVLARAGAVMPEVPYLAVTLAYVLWAESPKGRTAWGHGVFVAAAAVIRPAAVSIFPAALARPARRRDLASGLKTLAVPFGFLAAWLLWTRGRLQEGHELVSTGVLLPGTLAATVFDNALYYLDVAGNAYWPHSLPGGIAAGAVLAWLAFLGLRRELRRDPESPSGWILVGWAALHLVWPWAYERYLIPALPFLLVSAAEGLRHLLQARRPKRDLLPWCAAGMLAAQLAFQSWRWVLAPGQPASPELARTYGWIRERTSPDTVVASSLWGRDTLYAGRPVVPIPSAENEEGLLRILRDHRVRYVLWAPLPDLGFSAGARPKAMGSLARTETWLRSWPAVFREPAEKAAVYALPPSRAQPRRRPKGKIW